MTDKFMKYSFVGAFLLSGIFIADRHFSWSAQDVTQAYRCGVMEEARRNANLGPTTPDTEAMCDRLAKAGWSNRDKALNACFDIYNGRSKELRFDPASNIEAGKKMEDCFKGLDVQKPDTTYFSSMICQ